MNVQAKHTRSDKKFKSKSNAQWKVTGSNIDITKLKATKNDSLYEVIRFCEVAFIEVWFKQNKNISYVVISTLYLICSIGYSERCSERHFCGVASNLESIVETVDVDLHIFENMMADKLELEPTTVGSNSIKKAFAAPNSEYEEDNQLNANVFKTPVKYFFLLFDNQVIGLNLNQTELYATNIAAILR